MVELRVVASLNIFAAQNKTSIIPLVSKRKPQLVRGGSSSLHAFVIIWENTMHRIRRRGIIAAFSAAIFFVAPARAPAQDMVVGVNVVNPMRASVADQN